MTELPTRDRLTAAYLTDLAAAWSHARARHPDHTPYAFVLFGVEGGPRLTPYVLTEEDLTRVAQRYVDRGHHDTLDDARTALRYSVHDVVPEERQEPSPTADALLDPYEKAINEDLSESDAYTYLVEAAIPAFQELDRQGTFGTGPARGRVLLACLTFDVEGDWSLDSAKRLNPPLVFERFDDATRLPPGVFRSCDALAISPDARSLYFTASAPNPAPDASDRDTVREVVACDLSPDTPSFARRWTFTFPSFGDSVRALIATPDSRSLLALRQKVKKGKTSTHLMRFDRDSAEPTHQHPADINPAAFALSPDGATLAVASRDATLHFFAAATLEPLHTRPLPAKPEGLLFLRSGHLFVATADAVLDFAAPLDPIGELQSIPVPAHRLSADADESLLSVSRWFPPPRLHGEGEEFGVQLLQLPTLAPVRTFLLPGHQLVSAVLSPDGRRLACSAQQLGKPRRFLLVFDTVTGQEVFRRKYDQYYPVAFLPDGRTIAVPITGIITGEPVEFWTPPA